MTEDEDKKVLGSQLLPMVELDGCEFLVDVENRLFRNFKDPNEIIGMHSQQGRKMVNEMQGSNWKSYGLSTGAIKKAEV